MKTRLSLTGPLVVARDIAHAKIKERLDAGEEMPAYLRDHAVYYAGPAKTPEGYASGLVRPDHRGPDGLLRRAVPGRRRVDGDARQGQPVQGRSPRPATRHGGFYLGSIGGPAARLAQDCIKSVSVLEYEELGMEAVWKIEVEDFPAFIVVDDKGNDFFTDPSGHGDRPGHRDPGALRGVSGSVGRTSSQSSSRWSSAIQVSHFDHGLPGILTRMSATMPTGSTAGSHGSACSLVKTTFSPTCELDRLRVVVRPPLVRARLLVPLAHPHLPLPLAADPLEPRVQVGVVGRRVAGGDLHAGVPGRATSHTMRSSLPACGRRGQVARRGRGPARWRVASPAGQYAVPARRLTGRPSTGSVR